MSLAQTWVLPMLTAGCSLSSGDLKRSEQDETFVSPRFLSLSAEIETTVAGDQFQRDVRHWLTPPDPSTNHHIVWKGHHKGTGKWFFQSSILADWKSTGSLLWIHGKRPLPQLLSTSLILLTS